MFKAKYAKVLLISQTPLLLPVCLPSFWFSCPAGMRPAPFPSTERSSVWSRWMGFRTNISVFTQPRNPSPQQMSCYPRDRFQGVFLFLRQTQNAKSLYSQRIPFSAKCKNRWLNDKSREHCIALTVQLFSILQFPEHRGARTRFPPSCLLHSNTNCESLTSIASGK